MRGKTLFLRKAVEKLLRLGSGSGSLLLGLVCKTSTQARRLEGEKSYRALLEALLRRLVDAQFPRSGAHSRRPEEEMEWSYVRSRKPSPLSPT